MAKKLFDYVIGNPPYQEDTEGNQRSRPIYNVFMDEAYKVSGVTELITPGRFLFEAGQTPKEWNRERLNDSHFKVLDYMEDSDEAFPTLNVPIKGGIAITIRDDSKDYGAIGKFITDKNIKSILEKVEKVAAVSINTIHYNRSSYRLNECFLKDNRRNSESNDLAITSNIFQKYKSAFSETSNESSVGVYGLENNQRTYKWIDSRYVANHDNLNKWKVALAKSNGVGKYGEVLGVIDILEPNTVATQTFITFGSFNDKEEAKNLVLYLKTKFTRALLGARKVTPDNARKDVWKYVPFQNFTDNSDIDWSKSIHEIDLQLYKKYGLSKEEIDFIETHVKEME